MKTHTAVVKNRELTITSPRVVQNQLNADMLDLSLDSEWDGMAVSVIFGCGESAVKLLWEGEPVAIPSQLTAEPGYIPVTVAGYQGDVRVVSAEAKDALVVVASGCYDGSDPVPESQDMLGQLTQAANDATEAAKDARDATRAASEAAEKANEAAGRSEDAATGLEAVKADAVDATAKAEQAATKADAAAQRADDAADAAYDAAVSASWYIDGTTFVMGSTAKVQGDTIVLGG